MPDNQTTQSSDLSVMKVGSRKSELALVQTHHVIDLLQKAQANMKFEVVPISTIGDNILDKALSKIGEKALFTKELEIALEKKEVDFVVHSLKDLPTVLPDGMVIGAILEREDPRDAVILKSGSTAKSLAELAGGSVIGTSSLRRAAQLSAKFPHLKFQDVRGNLNTRLKKLDNPEGVYSALILAVAGVTRLGWSERISEYLESDTCMHAVGQGALAVECRMEDVNTLAILSALHHRETVLRSVAERSFLKRLEGGCSVPVAVSSQVTESAVKLTGGVWSLDGKESLVSTHEVPFESEVGKGDEEGSTPAKQMKEDGGCGQFAAVNRGAIPHHVMSAAAQCGTELADQLIQRGAEKILKEAKAENDKK